MTGNCEKWRSPSDIPNMYLQRTVGIKLEKMNGLYVIVFVWHKSELCRLMDILVDRIIFCVFLEVDYKIFKKKMGEFFPLDDANEEGTELSEETEGLEQKGQPPSPTKNKAEQPEDLQDDAEDHEIVVLRKRISSQGRVRITNALCDGLLIIADT
ncbi:o-acetyl-adp-ribose deacetylase macrod2 [Limosa lapponica baueri]|uniref:O-acetyl-adp-ribose deacetylase macrod2 n=1 Tax=Limosa lapponica baueri TaxID=1758121 RepID=A0A2I0TKZ7_LIMLA|nr:o-acetyl-adp-ribose deacetylase macrod2 [Limosa lapponica baueri]